MDDQALGKTYQIIAKSIYDVYAISGWIPLQYPTTIEEIYGWLQLTADLVNIKANDLAKEFAKWKVASYSARIDIVSQDKRQ